MSYIPNRSMPDPTSETFRGWLLDELMRVSLSQSSLSVNSVTLGTTTVEPIKVYEGLTVLADGVNWNPGGGQGVYTYYNSTWNKLG